MKPPIKSLALLLTILGLTGFGLLTASQAGEIAVQLSGYEEVIGDPGGESAFDSPLTIPAGTPLKVTADVSMEVSVGVYDGATGTEVFSDGLTSVNGILKGTLSVKGLQPTKEYVLKETYSGIAVPKAIVPLPDYIFTLPNVLTHKFTPDSPATYEIGIYARVHNLVVSIAGDLEGSVSDAETEKLAEKEGFTIPPDGLPDKLVIVIKPTIDVKANKTTLKYKSGFTAKFYKDTTLAPKSNPPVLTSVTIGVKTDGTFDPTATAYTDSVLGLATFTADDENPATVVPSKYRWLKNGSEIPGATGETLAGDNFVKGDKISLELTVKDETGKESQAKVSDNEIPIKNSPPGKPTLVLKPDAPTVLTPITVEITPGMDKDGDAIQSIVEWFFDDKLQGDLKGLTTIGLGIKKGTVVKVKVTSKDDEETGGFEEATKTIGNSPPVIAVIGDQTGKERQKFEMEIPVSDPDDDQLTFTSPVSITPKPAAGVPEPVVVVGSYKLVWDAPDEIPYPSQDFTIELEVTDGTDTAKRSFKLTITNANRAPALAAIDDDNHVDVDLAVSGAVSVDVSAADEDGDNLTYQMVSDSDEQVIKDAISDFNSRAQNVASGTAVPFSATFDASHDGQLFRIKVYVTDGAGGADNSEFTISVGATNRPPTLALPDQIKLEKTNIPAQDVYSESFVQYASDPDAGDTLTFESLATLPSDPTLQANGAFLWNYSDVQPNVYVLPIKVSDGKLAAVDSVTFNIVDPNDPPVLQAIGAQTVGENKLLEFDVIAHDPDGNFLEFSVEDLPPWATFSAATLTFLPKDATTLYDRYKQTFSGTPPYTVSTGDAVQFDVTFKVKDPDGEEDSETVTITVTDNNRTPVFEDVADITVNEGDVATFPVRVSDPDNDKLTLKQTKGKGTLDPDTLIYTWDLTDNYDIAGTADEPDIVEIEADDGKPNGKATLTVKIGVKNVNRIPTVTVEDTTVPEKVTGEYSDIPVSAADKDGDTFTKDDFSYASVPDLPFNAEFVEGSILLRVYPTYGHAGTYDITVSVKDSEGAEGRETFRLTVTKTNRKPTENIGDFTIGETQRLLEELDKMVSDPDGDPVVFAFKEGYTPPEGLVLLPGGLLSWTPTYEQGGDPAVVYTVEITITDQPAAGEPSTIPADFNISVLDENRDPTISVISDQSVNAGDTVTIPGITGTDLDGDKLTFNIESGPGGVIIDNEITLGAVLIAEATYTWETKAEDAGKQFPVIISLTDGRGGVAGESFIVTIGGTPPILAEVEDVTINEGDSIGTLEFKLDPDKDQPPAPKLKFDYTFEQKGRTPDPTTSSVNVVLPSGVFEFSWQPEPDQSGEDTTHKLVVTVTDENTGFQDNETVLITVKSVNRAPALDPISIIPSAPKGKEDLQVDYTDPTDPDGDALLVRISWTQNGNAIPGLDDMKTVPSSMTVPGDEWKAQVTAVDPFGASASQEATVTITDTPAVMTAFHRAVDEEGNPVTDIYVSDKVIFTITYTDPDGTKPVEKVKLKVWKTGAPDNPVVDTEVELKHSSPTGYYEYESNFPRGSYEYQASGGDAQSPAGSFTVLNTMHDIKPPEFEGILSGDIPLEFGLFDADGDTITVTILLGGSPVTLDGASNPMNLQPGEHEVTWKSATDLPNAAGETYTLTFQATGSATVTKTTEIQVQNKALAAPFLYAIESPVPKIVDIEGLKPANRGVELNANGATAGKIAPSSDTGFVFNGVQLRDGENTVKARSFYTYTYYRYHWTPQFQKICVTWWWWKWCWYQFAGWKRIRLGPFTRTVYSAWSNELKLFVDSENPEVTILSPEEIISSRTPEFMAYVHDKNLVPSSIVFKIDGASKNADYNPETNMASFRVPVDQPLGQGAHTFEVEAKDKAGNVGDDSLDFTINVVIPDTTPPIEVRKSPTGTVTGTKVQITVTDSQSELAPDTRKFELDGADVTADSVYEPIDLKSGTISYSAEIKTEGVHKVMVSIEDAKGNTGVYEWEFNVDNTGPSSPTVEAPECTADEEITVIGISEPGDTVLLILNGEAYGEEKADMATGAYSFLNVPLIVGANTIQALPTDAFGNVGEFSPVVKTFRDTLKPNITILSPKANQVIGTLTPLITASVTDDCGVADIELKVNGVAITAYDYNDITGLLSYQSAELPDDTLIEIYLKAVDSVGQERTATSSFFTRTVSTDEAPPAIETVRFAGKAVSRGSTVNTANPSPQLTALIYDTDSGVKDITLSVTDATGGFAGSVLDAYDTKTNSLNRSLGEQSPGAHSVMLTATDKNDNSSSFMFNFNVKTSTPTPTVSVPMNRTKESTIGVTVGGAEYGSAVSIYVNDVPVYSKTFSGTFSRDVSLNVGSNQIYAIAVNDVDIASDKSIIETVIRDVDAPSIFMESPINGSTVKPAADGSVTLKVLFSDPSGVDSVSLYVEGSGVTPTIEDVSSTQKRATYVINNPVEGVNNIRADATDGVGNSSPQQYSAFFITDSTPPGMEILTPGSDGEIVSNSIPKLSGSVDVSDVDVNSIETRLNTLDAAGTTIDSKVVPYSFSASSGKVYVVPMELEDGNYGLSITAADLVGNANSVTRLFEVDTNADDNVDPALANFFPVPDSIISSTALTLLSFITDDTSSGINPDLMFLTINGETFSIGEMLGTEQAQFNRRTGEVRITLRMLRPAQFGGGVNLDPLELGQLERSFGVGKNTITVQVSDNAGNTASNTWSFTVVTDAPETPVLTPPESNIISAKTLTVSGTVADVQPTNPVSVALYVNSVAVKTAQVNEDGSFTVEGLPLVAGNNTIDAIATDSAGNQSERSVAISVFVDQISPIVTIADLPAVTNQAASYITGNVTDDSGLPLSSVTLIFNGEAQTPVTDASFSFDVTLVAGENTIKVEAVDAAGNKGMSDEVKVTLDTAAPTTAPTGLKARVNLSGNATLLTWTADSEAATYNIYRTTEGKIADATGLTPIVTGTVGTQFEDFSVAAGTTYFYAITSVDTAGNEDAKVVSNSPNSALIPATGGTAALPDGTRATFSQTAIYSDTTLTASVAIDKVADEDVPTLDGAVEGTVRKFSAVGQTGVAVETFNKVVVISIPYPETIKDSAESPKIFALDGNEWKELESEVDTAQNIVSANVMNPGVYRIAEVSVQPWDINDDGVVDISDLILVGKDFGQAGTDLAGDVNGDGVVDIADLALVGIHFGESYGALSAAPAVATEGRRYDGASTQVTMSAEFTDGADGLYTISVKAQGAEDLSGFQFDVGFDENRLSIVKVVGGSALKSKGASFWLPPKIEKSKATIASAVFGSTTSQYSAANDAVLAKITLKLKGEPQAALESVRLSNVKLADSDGKLIPYALRNFVEFAKPRRVVRNALHQNYPNPFNPDTWIPYSIAEDAQVTISVYNVLGQLVRTIDLGYVKSGAYVSKADAAYWNGRNDSGERVASGVYFYTIKAGKFMATKRLIVLK